MAGGEGFYTALGTPLNGDGALLPESLTKHIEAQIDACASGLLLMGTMGMQPCVPAAAYAEAARVAVRAADGRVPLYVGVADNSVARVTDRLAALGGLPLSGVVLTPPFYFSYPAEVLARYFTAVADASPFPLYLYDMPTATKHKLSYSTVAALARHSNVRGIKTNDLAMAEKLMLDPGVPGGFQVFYSGLDTMDVGYAHGLKRYLDGMFSCAPLNARRMKECFERGDIAGGGACLGNILRLRDLMAAIAIFPAFTCAMNLLGFEGNFGPDLEAPVSAENRARIREMMREIGELK